MTSPDPHDLARFVDAQAAVYDTVLAELRAGRKRTHWMWFIFPQLRVLGRSVTALRYGIANREEAEVYLAHPLLGPRLRECVDAVMSVPGSTLHEVFGAPDDLKFRSCMTLFEVVADAGSIFSQALARWCEGQRDTVTLRALGRDPA
ncbi:MAG: DUF1810 domain-containing protein [Burkholderiales bacterium]|nr:DUF1810 domain-containing protein [Burkholderiales bacterium]